MNKFLKEYYLVKNWIDSDKTLSYKRNKIIATLDSCLVQEIIRMREGKTVSETIAPIINKLLFNKLGATLETFKVLKTEKVNFKELSSFFSKFLDQVDGGKFKGLNRYIDILIVYVAHNFEDNLYKGSLYSRKNDPISGNFLSQCPINTRVAFMVAALIDILSLDKYSMVRAVATGARDLRFDNVDTGEPEVYLEQHWKEGGERLSTRNLIYSDFIDTYDVNEAFVNEEADRGEADFLKSVDWSGLTFLVYFDIVTHKVFYVVNDSPLTINFFAGKGLYAGCKVFYESRFLDGKFMVQVKKELSNGFGKNKK